MRYTEQLVEWGAWDQPKLEPGIIQVYMKDGVPKMVDFYCPCGCGRRCPTQLVEPGHEKQPNDHHWNFSRGPNGITLSPSIRYLSGCKTHFNLTDGEAVVHADSGE